MVQFTNLAQQVRQVLAPQTAAQGDQIVQNSSWSAIGYRDDKVIFASMKLTRRKLLLNPLLATGAETPELVASGDSMGN